MPRMPERDLWAEAKSAEFAGWAEAQGYDDGRAFTFEDLREAFTDGMEALRGLTNRTGSTAVTFTFPSGTEVTVPPMDEDPRVEPEFELIGHDTFSADDYPLGEPMGTRAMFPNRDEALKAGRRHLAELERTQPSASSGGQSHYGIQDRVYIIHPSGYRERVFR